MSPGAKENPTTSVGIAQKANGLTIMGYIRALWPVSVAVIGLSFWLGGRMESPAAKEERANRVVQQAVAPLVTRMDLLYDRLFMLEAELKAHERTVGHTGMEQKMQAVQQQLAEIKEMIRRLGG